MKKRIVNMVTNLIDFLTPSIINYLSGSKFLTNIELLFYHGKNLSKRDLKFKVRLFN